MSSVENQEVGRRTGVVGLYTLVSRLFGLMRDMVLAAILGASATADAFYVAFRIPNLLRRLLAEGSMIISFVPVFTHHLKESKEKGREVASVVFTYLSVILAAVVVGGILLAPFLVRLIAYGFGPQSDTFALTVFLTRLMFPYIFLVSLMALAMGILNTMKRFVAPAASPILLNLGIMAGALWLSRFLAEPAIGVAIGVLVGGILQLALQIPGLRKVGMLPQIRFDARHPALTELKKLFIPSIFGSAVYQLNVMVITFFGSFLAHGSISYLWCADRLTEFPLGVFAIAIATATLPTLSDHASLNDQAAFNRTLIFGLQIAFLGTIPAAVGLFILAEPIVEILFERGAFDHSATLATAAALQGFAVGLPFISGVRNLVPAFYALKNPRTPVKVATVAFGANALLAAILMRPLRHQGLALAIALSSSLNFFLLFYLYRRRMERFGGTKLAYSILKAMVAALIMAVLLHLGFSAMDWENLGGRWIKGLCLLGLISAGALAFLLSLRLISREDYLNLTCVVKRRMHKS